MYEVDQFGLWQNSICKVLGNEVPTNSYLP